MSEASELTEQVVASFASTDSPRLRFVLTSLIDHLHAFVTEVAPNEAEWQAGIDFLTAVGHKCDDTRQEFGLLSDVLGVTMLMDELLHSERAEATESTVLGPFHVVSSPPRAIGDDISSGLDGQECVVRGVVRSTDGDPVAKATIDVWQASADGFYDVQDPDRIPVGTLRGLFTTGDDGRYWFRTVPPSHYSIPDDGPVGALLRATGRHPWRPAHIHFIASAPGFESITTHAFLAQSPYLDSDAVFGVRESLIRSIESVHDEESAASYSVASPYLLLDFDITLAPARVAKFDTEVDSTTR